MVMARWIFNWIDGRIIDICAAGEFVHLGDPVKWSNFAAAAYDRIVKRNRP